MPRGRQVRADLVPAPGEDAHQQQADGGACFDLESQVKTDGEMGKDLERPEKKIMGLRRFIGFH